VLTVVTGLPCSGKTTYVREHAKPGDVVIDFDILAVALGSPVQHDHPDDIRRITQAARRAAIHAAIIWHQRYGTRVWITECVPSDDVRRRYRRAAADIVPLVVPLGELHRRATEHRPDRWHALIDHYATRLAQREPAPRSALATSSREW
jgi:predicted ABC-type ATPase